MATAGRPLDGIRIVEFAGIGPAPFAAMLLADMGADILRIDRPGGADPWTRRIVRRGRASVEADLKNPADRAKVLALIARADALIEGFRPGVMERLGLGPQPLMETSPRLVYARMTGWGQDGPLAHTAGHDLTYLALSGALDAIGPAEMPVPPLNLVGDFGGGSLYLVAGLLAALLQAQRTGRGALVDAAIVDGAASLMAMTLDLADQGRWEPARGANLLDGGAPFYRCYPCADGRFVALAALERPFFLEVWSRMDLGPAPEEAERMDRSRWPELAGRIARALARRPRDHWADVFAKTDACLAPVLTLAEAAAHPHARARGTYATVAGVTQPGPAPRLDDATGVPPLLPALPDLAAALRRWPARSD